MLHESMKNTKHKTQIAHVNILITHLENTFQN